MNLLAISDAHLYPEGEEHPGRDRLHAFLAHLAGLDPGNLWIAGDLFDYWFEYRSTIPSGFGRTTSALRDLSDLGWKLDFLPGNHDWWVGRHFEAATGMEIHRERWVETETHGLRITMAHGDGFGPGDTGYRLLRPVVRSRISTGLFSLVHPTLGTAAARLFSGTSRRILRQQVETIPDGLRRWVDGRLEEGADVVMTGHTHLPSVEDRPSGRHVSLGDWIGRFTYSLVSPEGVQLLRFGSDGTSSPV